jgi:hypothetical protein
VLPCTPEPIRLASLLTAVLVAGVALLALAGAPGPVVGALAAAVAVVVVVTLEVVRAKVDSPRTAGAKDRALERLRQRLAARAAASSRI